jgi:hypothetical protein
MNILVDMDETDWEIVLFDGNKKPGVTLEVAPGQLTLYALVSAKSGLTSGNSHIDTAHLPWRPALRFPALRLRRCGFANARYLFS